MSLNHYQLNDPAPSKRCPALKKIGENCHATVSILGYLAATKWKVHVNKHPPAPNSDNATLFYAIINILTSLTR